jgi:membrane associated rhomboid family serine protease
MTPSPVGMRCPECARQRTAVHTLRSLAVEPTVTYVLIAVNVLMYLGSRSSARANADLLLYGPAVEPGGQWYRLVTAGFLHAGLLHIFFNMYALFWLGRMLEPVLGHARFGALYFASLLTGSLGVMIVSPTSPTVGASGAIFGLFGTAIVMGRNRGIDLMASGIGPILIINLVITFLPGSGIAIGGHVGGLIGGALAAFAIERLALARRSPVPGIVACVVLAVVSVAGALAVASSPV